VAETDLREGLVGLSDEVALVTTTASSGRCSSAAVRFSRRCTRDEVLDGIAAGVAAA